MCYIEVNTYTVVLTEIYCRFTIIGLEFSFVKVCIHFFGGPCVYYLLHRKQLHVSALDNGHLQVVYETHSKQLYETYIRATYMG